ncbi:hypothetical protein Bca52824_006748 [Brassica carinata]|uniref:DUF287 domain-containing protein n=1 Tax=Brassica carinata TaxID=52824 RepID=A0A8X7W7V2_BRACI|nr:hypothetical protein Bca52824_006748 [Brassica carinata]
MPPKTRLAEMKEKGGSPDKTTNESPAKKKKSAAETKKKDSAIKEIKSAVQRRREAMKKKRAAKKKNSEVEKKKKKKWNRREEEARQWYRRWILAESNQEDSEHRFSTGTSSEGTPSGALLNQPQRSPIQAPNEAENPLQTPVSDTSTKSPSRRVDDNDEEIGSNNRDSRPSEATIDNDVQRTVGDNMAVEPMRPVGFLFKPSEYGTVCKLSSRCHQHDFLEKIENFEESEKSWFQNHPQFKHIFHMDCCKHRKVQGLWMLLLRCMHTGKDRQAWFGVNGVPVRYSIREHALLTGLHYGTYPENYPSIVRMKFASEGRMKFATKHFKHLQKKTTKKKGKKQGLRVTEADFKRTGTRGFPLEDIYQALGNTKVISSVLEPQGGELDLLYEIMDEGTVEDVELIHDSDKPDIAVDGWNRILVEPEGKIFWEDLFEMDVRTRSTTQEQSEPHGIFEGHEEERAGRESVKELELRLNKRMEDGFALRDETICLLAARVKELEQDKIQRENWSFQFGEYVTGETSGDLRRDNIGDHEKDGDGEAEKDGEKEVEKDGEKEDEDKGDKDGEKQVEEEKDGKNGEADAVTAGVHTEDAEGEEYAEKEAYEIADNEDEEGQKEGETEGDKEGEKAEKEDDDAEDSPSTLEVMAEAAEKLEKAAAEKAAD